MVILQFVVASAAFLLLDALWLKSMNGFYRKHLGGQLAARPNFRYAVVFYLIYIAGILLFAVQPGLATGSLAAAFGLGAALGLFAYGTYNLTNAATLARWPAAVVVVDMAWGVSLTGLITLLTVAVFS